MPKHLKQKTILAIDPGTRELGYAVFARAQLLSAGVVPLRLLPRSRRLREVRRLLGAWKKRYRPQRLVLEATHAQPGLTFHRVHALAQAARHWAKVHRLPVSTYAPQTVRASVAGNGWAKKREVARAIASRFPELRVYLTQDRRWKERYFQNLFDAVALALHHQTKPPSRSRSCG